MSSEAQPWPRPRVYLAGPEVFLETAGEVSAAKLAICDAVGLTGVSPYDAIVALGSLDHLAPGDRAVTMYDTLIGQLDGSDAVIANITPFRGPSADVGTAWEMGYAAGAGKPVFAYTNRDEHYADRVAHDGMLVEAFDLADNLMLEVSVLRSDAPLQRLGRDAAGFGSIDALDAFRACATRAAAILRM